MPVAPRPCSTGTPRVTEVPGSVAGEPRPSAVRSPSGSRCWRSTPTGSWRASTRPTCPSPRSSRAGSSTSAASINSWSRRAIGRPSSREPWAGSSCARVHIGGPETVYNLAVDEDESYTADGCVVHNCQDYSVAKTLNQAAGIVGKKGVLWWEIHRLLTMKRPRYLFLENVDRLLKSPTSQRGRDFGVMLATLANLGYEVEWRVVNAADYGFPQKRRRVLIVGRLAGEQPRDPNEVIYRGTLARALPIDARPDALVVGDVQGRRRCRRGVRDVRGRPRVSRPSATPATCPTASVWTLDVDPAWDGPAAGPRRHPGARRRRPRRVLRRARSTAALAVPQGRQARAALPQGLEHAVLLRRGPHPLPRPDGLARRARSSPARAAGPRRASSTSSRSRTGDIDA